MHKATKVTVLIILLVIFVVTLRHYIRHYRELRKTYRLSDFVRHYSEFETRISREIYCLLARKSIVTEYHQRTSKAVDIPVLSGIVDDYEMNEVDKNDEDGAHCMIHVRLGDVIDNDPRSVSDFVRGINEKQGKYEGYVKPISYYTAVVKQLPVHVKRVVLVSGSHKPTLHPEKSQEYLQHLKNTLQTMGHVVSIRWNHSPDDDFVMLCRAKYVVMSGGGYSQLVAAVAKHRGNYVLP